LKEIVAAHLSCEASNPFNAMTYDNIMTHPATSRIAFTPVDTTTIDWKSRRRVDEPPANRFNSN
jgi:hypothetical protein